jgi:hypothetical protein
MSTRVLLHASDSESPIRARRIRDEARDGLAAAALSLGGSVAVTLALALLLRWLG